MPGILPVDLMCHLCLSPSKPEPLVISAGPADDLPGAGVAAPDLVPGDSSTAFSIAVGGSVTGTIDFNGDQDWYAFTATAGQSLVITLDGVGPNALADPYLYVYDAAGNVQVFDDDSGPGLNSQLNVAVNISGTYYIAADAFNDASIGDFRITLSEVAPPDFLDSIDWGSEVATTVVNVYFANAGQTFDGQTSLGWNAYEKQQAMLAFAEISKVCNLTFNVVNSAAQADFKLVTINTNQFLGYFNPPGETNEGVGVFARNGTGWDENAAGTGGLEQGGYGFITLIHEFGHGVGMAHPHDNGGTSTVWNGVGGPFGDYGDFDLNQGVYTTMSYNDGWQLHPSGQVAVNEYGYQGTMMAFDIALLQQKYGANTATATGDDVYLLPEANAVGTFWESIWDAGGIDAIAYEGSDDATIDLREASLGYAAGSGGFISFASGIYGGYTIANGVVIENASGGGGADTITGNDVSNRVEGGGGNDTVDGANGGDILLGGNGADDLSGGNGKDKLTGGSGRDSLAGDAGADTFRFLKTSDSGITQGTRDVIADFLSGTDVINLAKIDARTGSGNQAFDFIDTAAFSGTKGELRLEISGGNTTVESDTDGDGTADFAIRLTGVTTVLETDFVL